MGSQQRTRCILPSRHQSAVTGGVRSPITKRAVSSVLNGGPLPEPFDLDSFG